MAEENIDINVNENQDPGNENADQDNVMFTKEEVLAMIQSESDKRVAQALKTQQRKFEQKLSLSKLDGDEREKAEKDQKIKDLEEQESQRVKECSVQSWSIRRVRRYYSYRRRY